MSYAVEDTDGVVWRLPPFAYDLDHFVENVVRGRFAGREVLGYDLYGRDPAASVAIAPFAADCPPLTIAHENHRHWIERHAAAITIETELEEFNREWEILCPDPRFADALVDQRLIGWIEETEPPERERTFVVVGGWAGCLMELAPAGHIGLTYEGVTGFLAHMPGAVHELFPGPAPRLPSL